MAGESGGGWAGPELTAPPNPIDEIKGALGVLGAEVLTRAEARAPRRTGALASCGRLVAGEGGAVGRLVLRVVCEDCGIASEVSESGWRRGAVRSADEA